MIFLKTALCLSLTIYRRLYAGQSILQQYQNEERPSFLHFRDTPSVEQDKLVHAAVMILRESARGREEDRERCQSCLEFVQRKEALVH